MPTNTHYTDEQVETWIAEKYPMRGHRTGEMLRALLADRTRLEVHRAALLAEVRAWRYWCENSDKSNDDRVCAAVAATDARLGAEVTG